MPVLWKRCRGVGVAEEDLICGQRQGAALQQGGRGLRGSPILQSAACWSAGLALSGRMVPDRSASRSSRRSRLVWFQGRWSFPSFDSMRWSTRSRRTARTFHFRIEIVVCTRSAWSERSLTTLCRGFVPEAWQLGKPLSKSAVSDGGRAVHISLVRRSLHRAVNGARSTRFVSASPELPSSCCVSELAVQHAIFGSAVGSAGAAVGWLPTFDGLDGWQLRLCPLHRSVVRNSASACCRSRISTFTLVSPSLSKRSMRSPASSMAWNTVS